YGEVCLPGEPAREVRAGAARRPDLLREPEHAGRPGRRAARDSTLRTPDSAPLDREHPSARDRSRGSAPDRKLRPLPDNDRSAIRAVPVRQISRPGGRGRRELALCREDLRLRFDGRPDLARLSRIAGGAGSPSRSKVTCQTADPGVYQKTRIKRRAAMAATVRPIPEGYHSVTPYLILSGASEAIAFYKKALGASEVIRMDDPTGK